MGFAVQKLVWDAESRAGRGGGRDGAPLRYVMDTLGAWGTRRVSAWLIPTVSPHDGGESFIHSTSSFSVCVSLSSTNSLSCVVVIIYQTCCCWRRFLVAGRVLVFDTFRFPALRVQRRHLIHTHDFDINTLNIRLQFEKSVS
jgi:hypothetical protein